MSGDYTSGYEHFHRALAIRREFGIAADIATMLRGLGLVAMMAGDLDDAMDYAQEALPLAIQSENQVTEIWTRFDIAHIRLQQGDLTAAEVGLADAVAGFRQHGVRLGLFRGTLAFASAKQALGHPREAAKLYGDALIQ